MKDLTKEDLERLSFSYNHKHGISDSDVEKANRLRLLILNSRDSERSVAGDIMICKGPGVEYKSGHIQSGNINDYSPICVEPYIPFVNSSIHLKGANEELSFSTSGGYWFSIPEEKWDRIKYVGKRKKLFKAWGHCGPCADGAFCFEAEVNVWEYFSKSIY